MKIKSWYIVQLRLYKCELELCTENSQFIEVSEGCYAPATKKDPHILFVVGRMGMDYDFTGWIKTFIKR